MAITNIKGTPFSATNTGATATATFTNPGNATLYVTDIAGSTDKAGGLLLVKQGTTVIWGVQLATSAAGINAYDQQFSAPLALAAGTTVNVVVDGTTAAYANVAGYYL